MQGPGSRVYLVSEVWGLGSWVWGLGSRVGCLVFRVLFPCFGFRVQRLRSGWPRKTPNISPFPYFYLCPGVSFFFITSEGQKHLSGLVLRVTCFVFQIPGCGLTISGERKNSPNISSSLPPSLYISGFRITPSL